MRVSSALTAAPLIAIYTRAMPKAHDQLGALRIAAPCEASWEGMAGDERVRHCTLCSLNVYNFAEMTADEVRQLLVRTEGRVCARLYRRADGTVLTRDCPSGLRALRRRASRVAASLIAALLSLTSFACGSTNWKKSRGSRVKLEVERVATQELAAFAGVVRDETGNALPGVMIAMRDEAAKREVSAVTDVNGAFHVASLNAGTYRVEVTLPGFEPARMAHLRLKANEVTRASVALSMNSDYSVTLGVLVVEPYPIMPNGAATTLTQDFISKLPL
jgi:hypothetical protein